MLMAGWGVTHLVARIESLDAQTKALESQLRIVSGVAPCMEFCKYNEGLKFYWEHSEYPCECGNGIRADFEVEQ
jgi:hypothetical protein